jgi:hypothetical protein
MEVRTYRTVLQFIAPPNTYDPIVTQSTMFLPRNRTGSTLHGEVDRFPSREICKLQLPISLKLCQSGYGEFMPQYRVLQIMKSQNEQPDHNDKKVCVLHARLFLSLQQAPAQLDRICCSRNLFYESKSYPKRND